MRRLAAALLLVLGGCAKQVALDPARPEPVAVEPTLDGPVVPLEGTLAIPRAAWAPFTEACRTSTATVTGPPVPVPDAARQVCANVRGEMLADGAARIVFTPRQLSAAQLSVSLVRQADGSVSAPELGGSLLARASPEERAQLERLIPPFATGFALPPSVTQGTRYGLSAGALPGGAEVAVTCQVVGAGRLGGRAVVVSDCDGASLVDRPADANGVAVKGSVSVHGRLTHDVETGLVLAGTLAVLMPATIANIRSGRSTEATISLRESTLLR